MTTVLDNPAKVCNYALAKIGYKLRLGSLFDGTLAAKKSLDIYGQTRDALLSEVDWDFAERTASGVLLKQAPASYITNPWTSAYPPLPWQFEYAYPTDAVKIRSVKYPPISIPNFDPRYNRFSEDNDTGPQTVVGYVPPVKVILTNVSNAIIVYTGQVTAPDQWTAAFLDAFADRLGKALGPVLMGLDVVKVSAAEEQQDIAEAAETRG